MNGIIINGELHELVIKTVDDVICLDCSLRLICDKLQDLDESAAFLCRILDGENDFVSFVNRGKITKLETEETL